MSTTQTEVVERLLSTGIPDRRTAERALRATMKALGQRLMDDEVAALARYVPAELARVLDQNEYDYDFDADELYERIRRLEHVSEADAREHVAVVLHAIGEQLPPEVRAKIARALPEPVAENLLPHDAGAPPPYASPQHPPALSTLAAGRPGSRHPISEAAPPSGHTHSVATNDDPHGETKLSSSQGLTQERLAESLATGEPLSSDRTLSRARDAKWREPR